MVRPIKPRRRRVTLSQHTDDYDFLLREIERVEDEAVIAPARRRRGLARGLLFGSAFTACIAAAVYGAIEAFDVIARGVH